jgi:hypothetical protein
LGAAVPTGCSGGSVVQEPPEQNTEALVDAAVPSETTGASTSTSLATTGADIVSTVSEASTLRDVSTLQSAEQSSETSAASSGVRGSDAGGSEVESSSVLSREVESSSVLSSEVDAGFGESTWNLASNSQSLLSYASGDAGVSVISTEVDAGPEIWDGPSIVSRAGFVEIEPINYTRHTVQKTSSSARLFYSFRPADADPHLAPTFVFFNGGPGYGTSLGLMARGTGPMTVGMPEDEAALVSNPWSWSQLGNLLYIDTRQAGFSYSTLPDPSNYAARLFENNDTNFNDYLDAADLVRVMLRVLASTPGVQDNPIVLVGESYGGVRATMMLEFLLDHENLRTATWYGDATLADEIAAHYAAVGQNYADPRDQFPAQVLIQPFIAGTQFAEQATTICLPGSKELRVAEENGLWCERLDYYRDVYNIDEAEGWSASLDVIAGEHIASISSLQSLLGVEPTQIAGLGAAERTGAFRLENTGETTPQPGFEDALGVLQTWDHYHVASNLASFNADVYDNPYPCVYFSRVVSRVATFVTDADADFIVDTPALPATMMACQQLLGSPFVDSVVASHDPEVGEARPGHWTVTFNENSPDGAGQRKVRWPTYAAGHMVAVTQPQQLFEDVREFLQENEVIP